MTEPEQWEWVRLGDEEGRLDRLSAVPDWSAPAGVDLDGQSLLFFYPVRIRHHGSRELQFRKIRAGAKLLTEFVTLDEAPAERILAYARQYGPLGFCQHGDAGHRLLPRGCSPRVCTTATGQPAVREDTQWWRNLAGHARALLNVAAQLSKGRVDDSALARLKPELLFLGSAAETDTTRGGVLRRLWNGVVAAIFSGAAAHHLQFATRAH
jgi:hypothetical protein